MKILQLHTGFNLLGGAESMIIGLANEMSKYNDVTVCSVFKPNRDSVFYQRLDKKVTKVDLGVTQSGFSIRNVLCIYKYLKNTDFDVVHFHGLFYYFAFSIVLTHRRIKYVYTFHSDAYKEQGIWDKRIIWLKRFCLKHKWMNPVTISPQSQVSFKEYYGLESRLILNGIPRPQLSLDEDGIVQYRYTPRTRVFFHPGRISEPKNQYVLCRVFNRLIAEGEDVVLLIAGSKQDETIFESLIPFFSSRIVYLGERNDVPQLLFNSDGFCLPSIWEGLPITLLESLSVGCIPICSPVGGIVSVIKHGVNGFLSKSSSEEDYYSIMREFLVLSANEISVIKSSCKESFAPYSIEESARNYVSFYKEII